VPIAEYLALDDGDGGERSRLIRRVDEPLAAPLLELQKQGAGDRVSAAVGQDSAAQQASKEVEPQGAGVRWIEGGVEHLKRPLRPRITAQENRLPQLGSRRDHTVVVFEERG
jgi:hypothetical protein